MDIQSFVRLNSVPYSAGAAKSVYLYATADAFAAIKAADYFNSVTKTLKKGDIILVTASNGGTPTCTMLVVTSVDGAASVTTAVAIFA